tara:strand:+ start:14824 stop:15168 length:345 start_codon:yes stop_codon:yes gene_type:complete
MIKIIGTLILSSFLFLFTNPAFSKEIPQKNLDNLATKVSKKFSRTYCNTSNFGISEQGAMEFAIGETLKEFSKNKIIKFVNLDDINSKIVSNVERDCQIYDFPVDQLTKLDFRG